MLMLLSGHESPICEDRRRPLAFDEGQGFTQCSLELMGSINSELNKEAFRLQYWRDLGAVEQ